MFRCATMQSAVPRYLSCKYYHNISSMMIMPKEGMVCFLLYSLITKIYGLVKKSSLYLDY